MKAIFTFCLVLFSSTLLFAQNTESRPLADFFEIRVNDGIEVELIKSDNPRIEIETEGVSTDKVVTDLSSRRLRVRMRIGVYPGVQVKCKVYYQDLTLIQAMAAGEITSKENFEVDRLSITANAGGIVNLHVEARRLSLETMAAGRISLSGSADLAMVNAGTGGLIEAFSLMANEAEVRANTGASVNVNVKDSLSGRSSTGAQVNYKGSPSSLSVETQLGGTINRAY